MQDIPPQEQQGWRAGARETYSGGWILDVGVHAIRAVRLWFGEVERARCSEWNDEEVCLYLCLCFSFRIPVLKALCARLLLEEMTTRRN